MKIRFLLLLSVLFVSTIAGCKKDPTNEGGNENGETPESPIYLEEDLSFTRTLEEVYFKYNGIRTQKYKKIYNYDGNKELLYESYRDDELRTRWYNFEYNGLTRTYHRHIESTNAIKRCCTSQLPPFLTKMNMKNIISKTHRKSS